MTSGSPAEKHDAPAHTAADATSAADADHLRDGLVDYIRGRGTFRTAGVEHAFRTVPRHVFLPGVDLTEAYAPHPVVTKRAADGTAISSASSPNLVADMLELLDAAPGHRVLEIGAATGINAALLAEIVGETATSSPSRSTRTSPTTPATPSTRRTPRPLARHQRHNRRSEIRPTTGQPRRPRHRGGRSSPAQRGVGW